MSRFNHAIHPPFAAAIFAIVAGCGGTTTPTPPAAFDRPEALSFFCSDGTDIYPLEACRPDNAEDTATGSTAKDPTEPLELYAVVTQTGTGEVAAVQVTGETGDPPGVIDTDVRIPGYTFAAVGEVPSAVVTPPGVYDPDNPDLRSPQSQFTYVLSRGSSTLHVIETTTFRGPRGAKVTLVPGRDGGDFFPPDSRPTSMELTPDQTELVITLPNIGEVWFVPIDGGNVGEPVRVPLSTDVPAPVDFTTVAVPPTYEYVCGDLAAVTVDAVAPRAPVSLGAAPEPWGIAIDEDNGRALVADRNLPIIHLIDLATHAELTPIDVQVPTRELVLTPRVPTPDRPQDVMADAPRDQRLLYAIDETDQSVLAVDYTDPASPSFGGVLPVSPTAPVDRLEVPFPARAIEVLTPRYDENEPLRLCSTSTDVAPVQLHGVFLAVATTDGRVRIYDIFDLDAPCRGHTCAPDTNLTNDRDNGVAIGRSRPRIGAYIDDPGAALKIDPAPKWTIGTTTATVSTTGTTTDARLPALSTVECPSGLGQVFPTGTNEGALVCAVKDPWAAVSQLFEATWNGTVPFTAASGAEITGGTIDVRFDPCELGIIGSEQVPASGYLSDYGGDVVAITGTVPASVTDELATRCASLVQETEGGETTPVLLPILRATSVVADADASTDAVAGRLEVGDPINVSGFSVADVATCFPDQLQIEVRVDGVYLVQSGREGFQTPIVRGEGGACTVDPARADAFQRGRAFAGTLFRTPELAIQLAGNVAAMATDQASLTMTLTNVPLPLTFDVTRDTTNNTDLTSLLATLRYNPFDERLYIIDQATRGLVRLNITSATNPIEGIFR